jgi:hypothetical protein
MSNLFAGLNLVTMYYKMEQGKACAADGRNRGSTCFSNLESRSKVKGARDTSEASPRRVGEHWHPEASVGGCRACASIRNQNLGCGGWAN